MIFWGNSIINRTQVPIVLILSFVLIIGSFGGCKPKTRRLESNDDVRWAMMMKTMDDSSKTEYLNNFPLFTREKILAVLKKYERATTNVEYEDYLLGKTITVKVSLENGAVGTMHGEYDNGARAVDFYLVRNTEMIDSAYRFYPNGKLYSKRIETVDTMKRIYEEFYENGGIRSRNSATMLYNWHPNGRISAIFQFNRGQVVNRTLWYDNGRIKEMSGWLNDSLNGMIQTWDTLGNQTRKELYSAGTLKKKLLGR